MNKKKKQKDKHCYLISTSDEYELPVYIGDKMSDIASFLGAKSLTNLYNALGKNNIKSGNKIYKLNRIKL